MQFDFTISVIGHPAQRPQDAFVLVIVRIEPTVSKLVAVRIMMRVGNGSERGQPLFIRPCATLACSRLIVIDHRKDEMLWRTVGVRSSRSLSHGIGKPDIGLPAYDPIDYDRQPSANEQRRQQREY